MFGKDVILSMNNIGKKPPNFIDAAFVSEQIANSDYKFDSGILYYNVFR